MRSKVRNIILAIAVTVVAIILPAFLFDKWFEGFVFFACHWLIREQFKEQYHHIIPATCRVITGAVFFFGVCFILPMSLSLFSAIPINYVIGWVGFTKKQADVFEVKYLALKAEIESNSKFDCETCTEAQLVKRCRDLGMSEDNINLAIEFFIKKTPRKELAERYFIEPDSVKQKKRRMKCKLNNEKTT
jgi:hypothetical protein